MYFVRLFAHVCVCYFECLKIRGVKIKSMGSLLITYNDHQNIPFHSFCSDISDAVHRLHWTAMQSQVLAKVRW